MRLLIVISLLLISGCTTTSISSGFDDSRNESLAAQRVEAAHPELKDANIEFTSFNGEVLITGQVPAANLIPMVTSEVQALRNVKKVHNELVVAGQTSLLSKTNDSWITTKVKTAFSTDDTADATRIKVVTENSTVFLMGLVTRAEAEQAVALTRDIQGVQKIVKLFEYIN